MPRMSALDSALHQLAGAARELGLDDGTHSLLATPRRSLSVAVPLRRDDGTLQVLRGYRVQHDLRHARHRRDHRRGSAGARRRRARLRRAGGRAARGQRRPRPRPLRRRGRQRADHSRRRAVLADRGVAVSYFEWVQDLQAWFWSEAEVGDRLRALMRRAYDEVSTVAGERGMSLRSAAHLIAVGRVADAHRTRGLYP